MTPQHSGWRFIAGAKCFLCNAEDKVRINLQSEEVVCVACGGNLKLPSKMPEVSRVSILEDPADSKQATKGKTSSS